MKENTVLTHLEVNEICNFYSKVLNLKNLNILKAKIEGKTPKTILLDMGNTHIVENDVKRQLYSMLTNYVNKNLI